MELNMQHLGLQHLAAWGSVARRTWQKMVTFWYLLVRPFLQLCLVVCGTGV